MASSQRKDYYDILEVPPDATADLIREQYRFLVQAWHPDKFPTLAQKAKAEDKIKEINGAFEVLGNPAKRAQYDLERLPPSAPPASYAREAREWREREPDESSAHYTEAQREQEAQAREDRRREEEEYLRREAPPRRSGTVPPRANELNLVLAPGVELILVQIRGGEFLYGEQNWKVQLDEYRIGKYPVTNAQFREFLKAARYPYVEKLPAGKDDFPVVNVSWEDARAFCAWATKTSGQPIRLASEAEWEKAARGDDGRPYPWGKREPDRQLCNFNFIYRGITPVGQFSPQGDSPYGVADLSGNVWEWTADWYSASYLNQNPRANPKGAYAGESRVIRGGSFHQDGFYLRATHRGWEAPTARNDSLGFRCAR